jgi:DnaJ family protein C protein 28
MRRAKSPAPARCICVILEWENQHMDPVEEIIRKAQERGDFDNLPGKGRPLDLRENPFVPPDMQLAYRMLANSGYAPDVVEEDKALRARIAHLEQQLQGFVRRWTNWRGTSWSEGQRLERLAARERFLRDYAEEARAINGHIHVFNASAPPAMQRGALPVISMVTKAEERLAIP